MPDSSESSESEPETSDSSPVSETADESFSYSLGGVEDEKPEPEMEPAPIEIDPAPGKESVVKALTEARRRANRGGLLRGNKAGSSPLWPDFPPLDDEIIAKKEPELEEIEAVVTPPEDQEKARTIRKRLERFADRAVEELSASNLTITDFAGYLILQRGDESGSGSAAAATLVTDQLNRLSEAVGAPELGSTQISLSENRWLCLVEAGSATGGVLAQLQVPEPLDSGKTAKFREDLEAVLAG